MKKEENELLIKAKNLLEEEMSHVSFSTWIEPIEMLEIKDNTVYLYVKTIFQKDVLDQKYKDLIKNTFNYLTNKESSISVICTENNPTLQNNFSSSSFKSNESGLNPNYTFETYVVGNN